MPDAVELVERDGLARDEPTKRGEERRRKRLVADDLPGLGDEPADALEIARVESLHLVTEDTTNVTWTQPGAVGDRGATSTKGGLMNRISKRAVVVCAAFVTVLSAPAVARADVIGEWNAFAQAQTIPIRPTAHGESRGMAMVEGAVYDAVNALEPDHRPYLLDLAGAARAAVRVAGRCDCDGGARRACHDRAIGTGRRRARPASTRRSPALPTARPRPRGSVSGPRLRPRWSTSA